MTKYLVSPAEKSSTWSIARDDFERLLRERWPRAEITVTDDPAEYRALEWRVDIPDGWFDGALSCDGHAVVLEGAIEDCAEVALWFRALVPDGQPLLFYDEAFNEYVELAAA